MRGTHSTETPRSKHKLDFLSMVTGWRRVFCTSIPKHHHQHPTATTTNSPRVSSKLKFFSNPSTPRLQTPPPSSPTLRCRTNNTTTNTTTTTITTPTSPIPSSPKPLQCINNQNLNKSNSPTSLKFSAPSSPRSPSSFSLLKSSLRLSKGTKPQNDDGHNLKSLNVVTSNKSLRVYNDDEPLMSPSPGSHFNPIPELEENDVADEDFNFGHFSFINNENRSLNPRVKHVEVTLLPESAVVAVGRSHETHVVVVKLKAPPPYPAARRPPIDVVAVVDVSERMSSRSMKRVMRFVISSLNSKDRLSIVAFASNSKRLLPLRRMTAEGRRSARRIVDALGNSSAQCTMSATDALKKAAKVIEDRRQKNPVASIVIISNDREWSHLGFFNRYRSSSSTVLSTRFYYMDIPVHHFDPSASKNAPEDSLAKCVGGLLNVVVQDVRLDIRLESGSSLAEIVGVYRLINNLTVCKPSLVRFGDLCGEEEREILIELKVPTSSIGSRRFLTIRSTFKDPLSQELILCREVVLLIPRPQAVRSTVPNIGRLRNLHVTTRAIAESRRLTEHKDLSGAYHLLTSARALVMQSADGSTAEYVRGLEVELAELQKRRHLQIQSEKRREEPFTPTSAWRAAERLAEMAVMRKHMNRVSDLHGFENARF